MFIVKIEIIRILYNLKYMNKLDFSVLTSSNKSMLSEEAIKLLDDHDLDPLLPPDIENTYYSSEEEDLIEKSK